MGYRGVDNAHGLESIVNTASSHNTLYGATHVAFYACIMTKDLTFFLSALYLNLSVRSKLTSEPKKIRNKKVKRITHHAISVHVDLVKQYNK